MELSLFPLTFYFLIEWYCAVVSYLRNYTRTKKRYSRATLLHSDRSCPLEEDMVKITWNWALSSTDFYEANCIS